MFASLQEALKPSCLPGAEPQPSCWLSWTRWCHRLPNSSSLPPSSHHSVDFTITARGSAPDVRPPEMLQQLPNSRPGLFPATFYKATGRISLKPGLACISPSPVKASVVSCSRWPRGLEFIVLRQDGSTPLQPGLPGLPLCICILLLSRGKPKLSQPHVSQVYQPCRALLLCHLSPATLAGSPEVPPLRCVMHQAHPPPRMVRALEGPFSPVLPQHPVRCWRHNDITLALYLVKGGPEWRRKATEHWGHVPIIRHIPCSRSLKYPLSEYSVDSFCTVLRWMPLRSWDMKCF